MNCGKRREKEKGSEKEAEIKRCWRLAHSSSGRPYTNAMCFENDLGHGCHS